MKENNPESVRYQNPCLRHNPLEKVTHSAQNKERFVKKRNAPSKPGYTVPILHTRIRCRSRSLHQTKFKQ